MRFALIDPKCRINRKEGEMKQNTQNKTASLNQEFENRFKLGFKPRAAGVLRTQLPLIVCLLLRLHHHSCCSPRPAPPSRPLHHTVSTSLLPCTTPAPVILSLQSLLFAARVSLLPPPAASHLSPPLPVALARRPPPRRSGSAPCTCTCCACARSPVARALHYSK